MVLPVLRQVVQQCAKSITPIGARTLFGIKLTKFGPDPMELATGLEKKELEAYASGNDDPFLIKPIKRGVGTRDSPTKVPSVLPERIIGCVCNEDNLYIAYTTLHMGEPKRCECGHWFELVQGKGIDHPSYIGPDY